MESIGRDLTEMQRTPLAEAHVRALRGAGMEVDYRAGTLLARHGDPMDRFTYVVEGEVEVVNPFTDERFVPFTLGPTQFMGGIGFLSGGSWLMPMRAVCDTRVIEVPRAAMLRLMSDIPEMSDHIITVLAARHRRQLEVGWSALALVGAELDRDVQRVAEFASRNHLPFASYALGSADAAQLAVACGIRTDRPAVIFGRDQVVTDPTPEKVARLFGLSYDLPEEDAFEVVIVGGGPAGVAAAVYAGTEGLKALVVEDVAIGGQAGMSSRIENYMGFPTGISGADLVWRGEVQAMKFGTRFVTPRRVVKLERLADGAFCSTFEEGQRVRARAVVVATGVQYRRLQLDRAAEFEGAGIYYAATESEARFCRDAEAVVIGGGNSAGQAAMFLSRFARHVRVLVRGSSLAASMSNYLSSRLQANPKISIEYAREVTALHGTARLEAVTIRDFHDGASRQVPVCGVFVMVGAAPNTEWLAGLVDLDPKGFVMTGEAVGGCSPYATSVPGIFAVGDVRAGSVKRVASAVGEGSVVISTVWNYLNAPQEA